MDLSEVLKNDNWIDVITLEPFLIEFLKTKPLILLLEFTIDNGFVFDKLHEKQHIWKFYYESRSYPKITIDLSDVDWFYEIIKFELFSRRYYLSGSGIMNEFVKRPKEITHLVSLEIDENKLLPMKSIKKILLFPGNTSGFEDYSYYFLSDDGDVELYNHNKKGVKIAENIEDMFLYNQTSFIGDDKQNNKVVLVLWTKSGKLIVNNVEIDLGFKIKEINDGIIVKNQDNKLYTVTVYYKNGGLMKSVRDRNITTAGKFILGRRFMTNPIYTLIYISDNNDIIYVLYNNDQQTIIEGAKNVKNVIFDKIGNDISLTYQKDDNNIYYLYLNTGIILHTYSYKEGKVMFDIPENFNITSFNICITGVNTAIFLKDDDNNNIYFDSFVTTHMNGPRENPPIIKSLEINKIFYLNKADYNPDLIIEAKKFKYVRVPYSHFILNRMKNNIEEEKIRNGFIYFKTFDSKYYFQTKIVNNL